MTVAFDSNQQWDLLGTSSFFASVRLTDTISVVGNATFLPEGSEFQEKGVADVIEATGNHVAIKRVFV
jgi:hypothetical protein